jgi:hypothetical protein
VLTAGDLLTSWLAHDWLHARQLVRLRFLRSRSEHEPFRTDYAGTW